MSFPWHARATDAAFDSTSPFRASAVVLIGGQSSPENEEAGLAAWSIAWLIATHNK
jgi:hypothetical protein